MYNELLIQHNINPNHKRLIEGYTHTLEGVDSQCGDDVVLYLKIENGIITDAGYTGYGCAMSQAAADIMIDKIIGQPIEWVRTLTPEEEIKILSPNKAREKCALLGWNTLTEIIGQ